MDADSKQDETRRNSRKRPALLRRCLVALAVGAAALWITHWFRDGWGVGVKSAIPHPFDRRATVDERGAVQLFDLERIGDAFQYDPVATIVPRPDQRTVWDWPEHPSGKLVFQSNNLGFREDTPTHEQKAGPRILIAGDSHTSGLVHNSETFANRIESELRGVEGLEELEVINAGVAYSGPYCYAGMLRRCAFLEPDVFVAVLFTGNDFADDLKVRYYLDGWSMPKGDEEYTSRIQAALETWASPISQGFNQAYRWKHFPSEAERSIELVIDSYGKMKDECDRQGIPFLAVVLPTKCDVDTDDDLENRRSVLAALDLTEAELAINHELGQRFVDAMEAAGIDCFDATSSMRDEEAPLYWRRDYHLGLRGHAFLAEQLAPRLRARL